MLRYHGLMRLTTYPMVLLTVLLLPFIATAAHGDISDIVVTVTTDRSFYEFGEPVEVTVEKCNPTEDPITVTYSCPCCHDEFLIVDSAATVVSDCTSGCIIPVIDVTWQPGECKSDIFIWPQRSPLCEEGDQVSAGHYRAQNFWHFPSFSRTTTSADFVVGGVVGIPMLTTLGIGALVLALSGAAVVRLGR